MCVCVPFAQNEAIIVYRRYYVLRIQLRQNCFYELKKNTFYYKYTCFE